MTARTTRAYCVLMGLFVASTSPAAGEVAPGWLARAQEHIAQSEYRASRSKEGLQAPNRAHDLRTYFGPAGIRVHDRTDPGSPRLFDLRLAGLGRGKPLAAVEPGEVRSEGNRVEILREGLVEWYVNSQAGLEQGFTLDQAPAGEGPLALELALAHAEASIRGDTVVIATEEGRRLRYDELVVSDAAGRRIPARIEVPSAHTIRLVVDDAGARYPVVLDPVFSSGPDTQLDGIDAGDRFGFRVARAGDANGDGYDDVLVSASLYDGGESDEGAAFLFLGSPTGIADGSASDADARFEADEAGAQLSSVAGVGDANGDGYDDILVGAPLYDGSSPALNNQGATFLFLGGPDAMVGCAPCGPSEADAQQFSGMANAQLGRSVAAAGDINADGFADIVVGAPEYSAGQTGEGAVFVFLGDPAGIKTTLSVLESDSTNAEFGWSVAGAGDLDGDGYDDVAVGASRYSNPQNEEGGAFVFRGSNAGIGSGNLTTATTRLESNQGGAPGALFGRSVAGAGDVNGDGYADLLVGASRYDRPEPDEGALFVFHGRAGGIPDGVATDAVSIIESDQASAFLGFQSAGAGDVNGDGYADVLVGADQYESGASQEGEGLALLFLGSAGGVPSGNPNSADARIDLNEAGAQLGAAVAGAGDIDGDGFDDVVIGALNSSGGGAAFVYLGEARGIPFIAVDGDAQLEGDQAGARLGSSVASAGDVNGDGYADVIVGAPLYDRGSPDEGAAFVFHGGETGTQDASAEEADAVLESDQAQAEFGSSVAGAGDVNGDGYADVIVGSIFHDPAPAAFVFHGGASGIPDATAASADTTLQGTPGFTLFGIVSGAGDVNGDGYADVVVGAPLEGPAGEGAAFVFLGSPTGVADGGTATAATRLESDQAGSAFGTSVAGAGDVNRDGYGDLIVGANYYDSDESDEGAAFVFLGGPGGIAHGGPGSESARLEADQAGARLGESVAGAGDVNGDGYADVIVAVAAYDDGSLGSPGAALVFHGGSSGVPNGTPGTADVSILFSPSVSGVQAVAGVGDVNGDGYADVAVGLTSSTEPLSIIYQGGASGVDAVAESFILNGGSRVAGAGDVNGDGYADVISGLSSADLPDTDEGAADVYLGNGEGRPVLARQLRADGSGIPIQPGGRMVPPYALRLELVASHPAGAGQVAGEFEVCPLHAPFGDAGCTTSVTPFEGVDGVSPEAVLSQDVTGLSLGTTHRWRARALHAPATGPLPEFPDHGPWRRLAAQSNEADARSVGDCNDGLENDGDELADFPADPGCTSVADASENDPAVACDDGLDNDGDTLVDFPADPGCRTVTSTIENPQCDDNLDNDGDGKIDWNGPGAPDPQCTVPWKNKEKAGGGCGLGFEVAPLLGLLLARRGRRDRA